MLPTIARVLQVANPHDIPPGPLTGEPPTYAGRFDMEKRKAVAEERVEATACTSRHFLLASLIRLRTFGRRSSVTGREADTCAG